MEFIFVLGTAQHYVVVISISYLTICMYLTIMYEISLSPHSKEEKNKAKLK